MNYILGLDLSQFQGDNVDFGQVKAAGYMFGITRMTYAYPGQPVKIDPTANRNYYGMVAAGIVAGGYHKIGWTDPVAEADFFLAAMMPLAENDLLAHDMEPTSDCPIPDNWAAWEQAYVQRIYDRTGTWSVRYANISMNNDMPATGVVTNCAPWVAAPSFGWNDTVPVNVPITIQQGATAHVPGITANVCDIDAFFGEGTPDQLVEELKKIGYHVVQPTPPPAPEPPVVAPPVVSPLPEPLPEPTPTPEPVPEPSPVPEPTTPPVAVITNLPWYIRLLKWLFK